MHITIISECRNKSKINTRRIISAYLYQIGRNVWQGQISAEGLKDLKLKLEKTKTYTTSVICRRHHSKKAASVEWIVGNTDNFSEDGLFAFKKSTDYSYNASVDNRELKIIQKITLLAALFHDMGKASDTFQYKLYSSVNDDKAIVRDCLRHEMVSSLLLFPLTRGESDFFKLTSKEKVKDYFKNIALDKTRQIVKNIIIDNAHDVKSLRLNDDLYSNFKGGNKEGIKNFRKWSGINMFTDEDWSERFIETSISWLCSTHHKIVSGDDAYHVEKNSMGKSCVRLENKTFFDRKFINYNEIENIESNLTFSKTNLWDSDRWCELVSSLICEIKEDLGGKSIKPTKFLTHNLYYGARTSLVFGDQIASHQSEVCNDQDPGMHTYANTTKNGLYADNLYCHTMKVFDKASESFRIVMGIPAFSNYSAMPSLKKEDLPKAFKENRETPEQYKWQDVVSSKISILDKNRGFFGVVVSETGSGKTKALPQIACSLRDSDLRFTLALGRRTLTKQAYNDYTSDVIGFKKSDISILIGQNISEKEIEEKDIDKYGSGSIDGNTEYVFESENTNVFKSYLEPIFYDIKGNPTKEISAITSPITIMTIDHIIKLVGQSKSSDLKHMLIAQNNDLVIDEIDDFDVEDLIPICKLVHLYASFGRKVIISSATINKWIVHPLRDSYVSGYKIYQEKFNIKEMPYISTVSNISPYIDVDPYMGHAHSNKKYDEFIEQVSIKIRESKSKRKLKFLKTLSITSIEDVFKKINHEVGRLSDNHYVQDHEGFKVSSGVIRFNNVKTSQEFFDYVQDNLPENIKVLNYHSKMLNIDRLAIEDFLDDSFKRKNNKQPYDNHVISEHIKDLKSKGFNEIITIISTTNIIETGRDHDYDWAISEPMSDQSLVQLSGRILRHRDISVDKPNVVVLDRNIKKIVGSSEFLDFPGIESEKHTVKTAHKYTNRNQKVSVGEPIYGINSGFFLARDHASLLSRPLNIRLDTDLDVLIKADAYLHSNHKTKIDSECCLRVPDSTREVLRTIESLRAFDFLIRTDEELQVYINEPFSNLNSTSKDNSMFRKSEDMRESVYIEKDKPEWGLSSNNWIVIKDKERSLNSSESSNLNLEINVNEDWGSNSLLRYDFNEKLNELIDRYETNKGSLKKILLSTTFQAGRSVIKIDYSSQKGVEE